MLYKNTLVKIKKTFGRYISLLAIILIGLGFFAGITVFSPSIKNMMNNDYKESNLMDFKIVSSTGISDNDINTVKNISGIKEVVPSYSIDVLNNEKSIRVHSLTDVNKVNLIDGRMPEDDNECLADDNNYKLGDIITITSDTDNLLSVSEYKVVGTINSVLYLFNDYGNSTVGDGKLDSFIFINEDNFLLEKYTEMYIVTNSDLKAYTKEYDSYILKFEDELLRVSKVREKETYDELFNEVKNEVIKNNPGIKNAPSMLDSIMEDIEIPTTKWQVFDRSVIEGYDSLNFDLEKVEIVATYLPIIFILIVVMMSLNTINRMITEERGEMGVLTSLGFSSRSIINTYLAYVLSATILGIVAGYYLGCFIIPRIIYSVFNYNLPPLVVDYDVMRLLLYIGISLLLMIFVTLYSCMKELTEKPAKLLRPIPPKKGKGIFLEKINFFWKHISFTWKTTIRNIFRYKKRGIMTILGITCCTALLLIGFGIKDSINNIGKKQYNDIFKYETQIILKDEILEIDGDFNQKLKDVKLDNSLLLKQTSSQIVKDKDSIDVLLILPENKELFEAYFNLKDTETNESVTINDNGAIITKKVAEILNINVGDKINILNDNETYNIVVTNIVENYVTNYIYISKSVYKNNIDSNLLYNSIVSNYDGEKTEIAKSLLDKEIAINVNFSEDLIVQADNQISGLNSVILLIIFISAMLTILVLYNLTSINVSERTREIATIKVLGFTDGETNEYIYRETFVLGAMSILLGLGLGVLLHTFLIPILEGKTMVFAKDIKWYSYIYTTLLMLLFIIIMQVVTYIKLKKVDMIESLKSVE